MNEPLQAPLNFDHYIAKALRSEQPLPELRGNNVFTHMALEVLIAAADLADLLKKELIYGKTISREQYVNALTTITDCVHDVKPTLTWEPIREHVSIHPRLLHAALGGFGEQGEMLEALISAELDVVNVFEEVGDTMWYLALAADACAEWGQTESTVTDIANRNIAKLAKRFPDKFSLEASEGRDVAAERKVLEGAA